MIRKEASLLFSIEFISQMKNHIATYQNYPYPVVLCDLDFKIFWGNPLAKQMFPQLFVPEGMKELLTELDIEEIKEAIDHSGSYGVGGLLPLDGTILTLSGVFYNAKKTGYAGLFVRKEHYPELDYFSKTIPVFNNQIRHALHETFSVADNLALKADILHVPWVSAYLNAVGLSAYEILRLSSNITAFSRLQYFQDIFIKENVPLVKWMNSIKSGVEQLSAENQVTVSFDLPTEEIYLPLDLEWFQIAFFNILHNSLYYTREGNHITISIKKDSDWVKLVVADRGIGLPPEVLDRATDSYYSYAPLDKAPSVGLGLTIAHRVLGAHDGTFEILSKLGEGTTVIMAFPKGGFSQPLTFAQNDTDDNVANRFSHLYIGLTSAIRTPYKEDEKDNA